MGRRHHLRAALLGCIAASSPIAAPAQDVTIELPNIDVTSSRLGTSDRVPSLPAAPSAAPPYAALPWHPVVCRHAPSCTG